ncbi:MAG: hypothetical protein K2K12_00885, partial [Clostridia bacterium]|nr:hypothetical protein [Clostridia bacterium]
IKIIKGAESTADAREKLKARFSLSERQAQAILDLRLARLTKLEIYKLEEEHRQLQELIKKLTAIVNSPKLLTEVVKSELLEIKKKYKTPRKSKLVFAADEAAPERADVRAPGVSSVVCITADGKLKCVTDNNYGHSNKKIGEKSKLGAVMLQSLNMKSDETLLVFSDRGNGYRIAAENFACKFSDSGFKLSEFFEEAEKDEKPVAIFPVGIEEGEVLFITKLGMLKKTAWSEYTQTKNFFQAVRLNEGDSVITVQTDIADENETVFFVTRSGMCLNARKDDIPTQGRIAGGVKGMNLKEDDDIVFASQIDGEGEIVVATSEGRYKRVIAAQIDSLPRYRKGVQIASLKGESVIFADYVTVPYMLAVVTENGMTEISTEDIPIDATNTRGRALRGVKWTAKEVYAMKYREIED